MVKCNHTKQVTDRTMGHLLVDPQLLGRRQYQGDDHV